MPFDALILHPPALYDFRRRPQFPGPIGLTVADSTHQFIIFPVGLLSIAEYLDRNGYSVAIDNLGERMMRSETFDVENHLRSREADVYAIDLHWCVHSQGAVEIARVCKLLHPNSFVLLGGLTATCFHDEIISNYPFVDGVIRGEAEAPLLQLLRRIQAHAPLTDVPNLTFREGNRTIANKLCHPCSSLDEFDFTRLDLVTPRKAHVFKRASIPICRGCIYNCISCGGSAYSYRKMFGREKPAFRSPGKILEDLARLDEQGVEAVFLFQDARMGGARYWRELVAALKSDKSNIKTLALELFEPATPVFLESLVPLRERITLTISPESGVDRVRKEHGRTYTNQQILSTANLCRKFRLSLTVFFMVGLAGETYDTMKESKRLWEKLYRRTESWEDETRPVVRHGLSPMILLDPGSLAFDKPEKYGYRLLFKKLADYVAGMTMPSWHQWISYETRGLSSRDLARITLFAIDESIRVREKYGIYRSSPDQAVKEYFIARVGRVIVAEVDKAMRLPDTNDRLSVLGEMLLRRARQNGKSDPYGYGYALRSAMQESVGLLEAAC